MFFLLASKPSLGPISRSCRNLYFFSLRKIFFITESGFSCSHQIDDDDNDHNDDSENNDDDYGDDNNDVNDVNDDDHDSDNNKKSVETLIQKLLKFLPLKRLLDS